MIYTGKVSKELSDFIERNILSENDINWLFCSGTSYYNEEDNHYMKKNISDIFQFEHRIVSSKYGVLNSKLLSEVISPLVEEYQQNYPNFPKLDNISRGKINILTQNNVDDDLYHIPHTDDDIEHWVMIYYINDTDGDTFIFNETCYDIEKELTIKKRISPEKGKFAVFNGKYLHSSSSPKKSSIRSVWECTIM